jgi:hypothetical protein
MKIQISEIQIPPMTDPLGRHWKQPDRSSILVDDAHAVMDRHALETLAEYSSSRPSGVYPGKMWKRLDGIFDSRCKPEDCEWRLCWYGECEDKRVCSINCRTILVAS